MNQPVLNPCACGCGTLVAKTWARGHSARGYAKVQTLPPPDAPDEAFEDLGVINPFDLFPAGGVSFPAEDWEPPPLEQEKLEPEPEPAHARKDWRRPSGGGKKSPGRAPRLTQAIRGDINGKISFALEIPGRVWAARDPVCGGTFVQQRGEIADALTEIVCQSPDLVAWFTGPGGSFMLYLNLAAACWPVATVALAHHVYHTLDETPPDSQQPDYSRYAA
jgi:hypothetical protein